MKNINLTTALTMAVLDATLLWDAEEVLCDVGNS